LIRSVLRLSLSLSLPPGPRNLPDDIVAVEAGGMTSAALTATGTVYVWGNNDDSALGCRVGPNEEHLIKVMESPAANDTEAETRLNPGVMRNVAQIRMGDSHSIVLTTDGKVYTTGMYKDRVRLRGAEGWLGAWLAPVHIFHFTLTHRFPRSPNILPFVNRTLISGETPQNMDRRAKIWPQL
jgi:alpha-tubulin suppressor-like RCC1 family protein